MVPEVPDWLEALQRSNPLLLGATIGVVIAAAFSTLQQIMAIGSSKRWSPEGKNILVTGGSQGLGLSLALLLAKSGANVTIAARTEDKLRSALCDIQKASRTPAQKHTCVSADLSTFAGAKAAVAGCPTVPDTVFCCAGGAKPGYFLDQEEEDFELGFRMDYMTALGTSHAAGRAMREAGIEGKIILVSSMIGFFGFVGYSQYAPMKAAIKGLAETLRSEFLLYNIGVHCYFPATILSPGFETEQKTKPAVTKKIEESDNPQTPEVCAARLLQGVARGNFFITSDFQTDLFRAASAGVSPGNGWFVDRVKNVIALIALPIWRKLEPDRIVKRHREQLLKASEQAS